MKRIESFNEYYRIFVLNVVVTRTEQLKKLGNLSPFYLDTLTLFNIGSLHTPRTIANSVVARGHLRERLSPSRITPG